MSGVEAAAFLAAIGPSSSRAEAVAALRRGFAAAGLDTPGLDARILCAHALGIAVAALASRPEQPIGVEAARRLIADAGRRLAREPVARILGAWEFWGMPIVLSAATLVPRPDSETLVSAVLAQCRDRGAAMRVLDLGTGSGCLLLALLREYPAACGLGLDRSLAALATARANALRNRLAERSLFAASDWAAAGRGPFDLIVANPPYIRTGDLAKLAPEVRDYEPRAALDGGADGLAAYRVILPEMARLLAVDGLAVVEIGADQEEAVTGLSARAQLAVVAMRRDLGGRPRALVLRRSAAA